MRSLRKLDSLGLIKNNSPPKNKFTNPSKTTPPIKKIEPKAPTKSSKTKNPG